MQLQHRLTKYIDSKFEAKGHLILAVCFIYIIQFFLQSFILNTLLSLLCVVLFFISLAAAQSVPRFFGFSLFFTGIATNITKGNGLTDITNGVLANLPLLVLLILVPLLSIPMKMEGYFNSVHFFMEKLTVNPQKLFGCISLSLFCLGPILNMGSIRLLHEMIKDLKIHPVLLAKAYSIGFSTVVFWSPYLSSVALVLYCLKIPVYDYIPIGFTMAVIQLVIGNLLFRVWSKKRMVQTKEVLISDLTKTNNHKKKILDLILSLMLLVISIFIMEKVTHWPIMFLLCLVSILYPAIWSILKKQWKNIGSHFKNYKIESSKSFNNEIVLFISAGLFASALSETKIADGIQFFLYKISNFSFLLFIVLIITIFLLFTFMGVHQIVIVTALATQMDPILLGSKPEALALLLLISWSMAAVLSPVNPLNLIVSSSVDRSALLVGFRWNGIYLLSMFLVGTSFVYFIH